MRPLLPSTSPTLNQLSHARELRPLTLSPSVTSTIAIGPVQQVIHFSVLSLIYVMTSVIPTSMPIHLRRLVYHVSIAVTHATILQLLPIVLAATLP
jgi:hypothetical protein